jgi:two-component sensor histidine kinase/CheY-like chemotaxis protein
VKNTLATVQAIASLSARRAASLAEFVPKFTKRIHALAKAHTLLARARMEGAEVAELIHEQVILGGDARISCSGPRLMIDPQSAIHLAMVLHELATNARRHGALSVAEGRLAVTWELRSNGGRALCLHWEEHGAPVVKAPERKGFGTTLIEQTLRGRGGKAVMRYGAGVVTSEIVLPLPATPGARAKVLGEQRSGLSAVREGYGDAPGGLAGKRVLVIEDEPMIALDMELMLSEAGCEVAGSAGTIEQARQLVAEAEYDVAVVDGNLGGEPVDEIAIDLTRRNIPFAFVTGYGRDSLPQGFRDAVVVSKPFSSEQLIGALLLLLGGANVRRLRAAGPSTA